MFNKVGSKLKIFSWVVFGIGVVMSIISGVACFVTAGAINNIYNYGAGIFGGYPRTNTPASGLLIAVGVLAIIFGCALSYIFALITNGFGRIVEKTTEETPPPADPLVAYETVVQNRTEAAPGVAPISVTNETQICSQCGAENKEEFTFCVKCGNKLN